MSSSTGREYIVLLNTLFSDTAASHSFISCNLVSDPSGLSRKGVLVLVMYFVNALLLTINTEALVAKINIGVVVCRANPPVTVSEDIVSELDI